MSLAGKYTRLKKMVGGNREKVEYEETFGMPKEEFFRVTVPNAEIRRVLAEVEFSINLSKSLGGKFDPDIESALDFLQCKMDSDGVLTKSACTEGERLLLPLQSEAKKYKLILAAHAHIDMNWMWGWQETVASTIATFQTMLKLMDEYPKFHFSQSQAAVYKIIEDYAPELKPQIEQRIREGRWEVTASAWVETDKNMPSTESLLGHISYTRKYLSEHWGIDAATLDLDFSPDTFGHSANLPELDRFSGVNYYYHCRGLDGDNALYRWKAPSGKELLVYREQYWYNSGITPLPAIGLIDISKRSGGLKTGLVVYGVGDHGGGPSRKDIERAMEMQNWPVFPEIQFGTFHDFFREAETVREKLPVVSHELNMIFPGCYTTQSRIKMGNRHAECALFDAQAWNALANKNLGTAYLEEQYESAWQGVLFTHFHDILTGSCVQETREHAMGQFAHAMAVANSRISHSLTDIINSIDTSSIHIDEAEPGTSQSEGAGAGYGIENFSGIPVVECGRGLTRIFHVFSSSSRARKGSCEITVWDWTGDLRCLQIEDTSGNKLSFQLLNNSLEQYWDHKYFKVLVEVALPPCGYSTIVLREKEVEDYKFYLQPGKRSHSPSQNIVLENKYLRAEFDYKTGIMISMIDHSEEKEWIRRGKNAGLRYILTESKSSNAWEIGRYIKECDVFETTELTPFSGELQSGFTMKQKFENSTANTTITLDKNSKSIKVAYEIDWHEVSRFEDSVPILVYKLPLCEVQTYRYDVPGGTQNRHSMEQDVPALQYGAAVWGEQAALISTDSKYGYRGYKNNLVSTLINATKHPDLYPERGIHHIVLHIGVENANPKSLEDYAFECNHPIRYQSGTVHSGSLPLSDSLLKFDSESAVVSGIFNQNSQTILRIYETCGNKTAVKITTKSPSTQPALVDLYGKELKFLPVNGCEIDFNLDKNSVAMVRL